MDNAKGDAIEGIKRRIKYEPDSGQFYWVEPIKRTRIKPGDIAGSVDSNGYVLIEHLGKKFKAHRLAFLFMSGAMPDGVVDHKNGVTDDNRWSNLRIVDMTRNARNAKLRKTSISGLHGVTWHKTDKRWRANITINDKAMYLGNSKDFFEACCLRKSAENKYGGFHENHGRR